jgi:ferric-dicitrate binding protein FerR (iron transport regulator)
MPVRRRAVTAKLSLLMAAMAAVCLAQFPPPSDSGQYAAKVLTMSGQVSVLKDMRPIALSEGSLVQVQEMIVTGPDGHAVFQVSDGSTFEVYPNTNLVFRKNAWNVKDMIDLLVGRIRVHIEHWGNVPNPNRVLTPTAVISVRGTTFDVTVDENDETTMVEVEEGLVEVRHALLPSDTPKMLGPGDSIKVYKSQPIAGGKLDKGAILHYALNAIKDAANVMAMRANRGIGSVGGGSTGGSTGVGDTGKGQAPAPPPPPPPPPPPGHYTGPQAKHHSFGQVMKATAKYSLGYLERMVGFTAPTFDPLKAHRIY